DPHALAAPRGAGGYAARTPVRTGKSPVRLTLARIAPYTLAFARPSHQGAAGGAVAGSQVKARSSGGERYLDTVEVSGSNPLAPTTPGSSRTSPARAASGGRDCTPPSRGSETLETINVTLPDGSVRPLPPGTTLDAIARAAAAG